MQQKLRRLITALVCVALVVPLGVSAQSGKTPDPTAKTRRAPLPNYFGKIAVSDEQREQLQRVQDEYEARIEDLQKQVKALIQERDGKMEALLTPGQKLRLKELRDEARAKGAKSKDGAGGTDAADAPAPAKSPKS